MVRWIAARCPAGSISEQALRRTAGQLHGRLAARQVDHAHVAPEHAVATCRCRAPWRRLPWRRSAWRRRRRAALRRSELGLLDVGEDARDEALAIALQRLLDAPDVDQVAADADDHVCGIPAALPARDVRRCRRSACAPAWRSRNADTRSANGEVEERAGERCRAACRRPSSAPAADATARRNAMWRSWLPICIGADDAGPACSSKRPTGIGRAPRSAG